MTRPLRIVIAVSSIISGALHFDIWANLGYKSAPVKELFVIQAVLAVVAGLVALAPRTLAVAPALAVNAGSLIAFALSRTVGVPTFHGSFEERALQPSAVRTIVVLVAEVVAVVVAGLVLSRRTNEA